MSKIVASLPKGLMKNSVLGAIIALVCYISLQFICALLIYCGTMGEGMTYLMVCVSAAIASFLGCGFSAMRNKSGAVLSASTVVMVFLTLTVAVALLTGEAGTVSGGLTGVGSAMAVGGLLAALLVGAVVKNKKSARVRSKMHRTKK